MVGIPKGVETKEKDQSCKNEQQVIDHPIHSKNETPRQTLFWFLTLGFHHLPPAV
ncbi:Uncharacterised protein [Streptococcus pneumoniae]|nr:Uncharacterised protein [Streptococcus pneumoniae]CIV75206.1 Uncharacterised protein [Streptococcus pneumoniae]